MCSIECYLGVYFPCCCATWEINTKIALLWVHKHFTPEVHTLFYITHVPCHQWWQSLHYYKGYWFLVSGLSQHKDAITTILLLGFVRTRVLMSRSRLYNRATMEADILTFTGILTPEAASVASCFPFDIKISLSWFPPLCLHYISLYHRRRETSSWFGPSL